MRTRRRSPVIRTLALLGLCSWLVGCHHWVAMDQPYAESITDKEPGEIRITIEGTTRTEKRASGRGTPTEVVVGQTVELREPAVIGDSIGSFAPNSTGTTPKVALSDVAFIDQRKTDVAATVFATFGIFVGVLAVAGAIYAATDPCMVFCY